MKKVLQFLVLLLHFVVMITSVSAADQQGAEKSSELEGEIRSLKKQVMELNRDLFILEEDLLFPSSTQLAVFLSLDIGEFFKLDSVKLKIDDKEVSNYLYTVRERKALARGGVQRLYMGNIRTGKHELVALFVGIGPNNREYRRGASLEFEKTEDPKFIELKISDAMKNQQPKFTIKEWQ
jgi:hypothetical protein